MTYKESLSHPLWQEKRLRIFERDNFTCRLCHSREKTLEVHHLFYLDLPYAWDYSDDCLITLCADCHDKERNRTPLEKNLSSTLRMKGFLISDLLAFSSLIDTDKSFTKSLLETLREFQNG